jgi:hypothetical protein
VRKRAFSRHAQGLLVVSRLKQQPWSTIMSILETSDQALEVRHLTDGELDAVNGGFIWIAAFAVGALVGYGCRRAGDAAVEWAFGDEE